MIRTTFRKCIRMGDIDLIGSGRIEDNRFEPLRSHDGPQAAARGVARRIAENVRQGYGRALVPALSGDAGGDDGDFVPVFFLQGGNQFIIFHAAVFFGRQQLGLVLCNEQTV